MPVIRPPATGPHDPPVVMGRAGGADQLFSQTGRLLFRQQPADHQAAEDVEQDVEAVEGPQDYAPELRDVPAPELVGTGG